MVPPYEVNCITWRQFFAKSGTNLRRKFADPGKDCHLETHIAGAASFMACTFSPEGEIPAVEMVLAKGTQVNRT